MKEVIAKLERILELTSTHGITLQPENKPATSDDQLMYVESKIRLNAIQALDIFDKNNIEKQKPRTKTEFVKVNYGMEHFAAGSELFSGRDLHVLSGDGNYYKIKRQDKAVKASQDGRIYEKVEPEIDERQEFIDVIEEHCHNNGFGVNRMFLGSLYDSGKFKLVEK